jgi:adenine deaminase
MTLPNLLAVARGDHPADLLLRRGRLVNVYSGQIEEADIAIAGNRIAGVGPGYSAAEIVDLDGSYVTPGLIDAHVHIESSLCVPAQFAAALLPRGVTCVVTDPHEIANVAGLAGVRFMARAGKELPLTTVIMASSCIPATHLETTGAALASDDLAELLAEGVVHGLAEVMNYPGVIQGDAAVLAKLTAFRGRPVDGHAPKVHGHALNAYIAAGIGSEHECTTVAEAAEKLARGMVILIREATIAPNLHALLPLITPANSRRICFCTDDRTPGDLLQQGSIDYMVREAIAYGIDPVEALRMATLNLAEWFGLHDRGGIAPGRIADLLVVDDLRDFRPRLVFAQGKLVAQDGHLLPDVALNSPPAESVQGTMRVNWQALNLRVRAQGAQLRAIGAIEGQLLTEEHIVPVCVEDGFAVADPARDLLKIAAIERHHGRGATGHGFIQGIGLRQGAIAGSVAHDHHNLMVIGADDDSMLTAARTVAEMGGGLVVALDDQVRAALPLPIAGLMSDRPIREVAEGYAQLIAAANALGSPLRDPFMVMSFMGLEVIPKLKLTDQGLVDVEKFAFVELFIK